MARSLKYVKTTYTCNVLSCMCLMLNLNNPHSVENWPSRKLPFECQKIAKNLTFFEKKCQVFGNFLTFKWQFSGGSGCEYLWYFSLLMSNISWAFFYKNKTVDNSANQQQVLRSHRTCIYLLLGTSRVT